MTAPTHRLRLEFTRAATDRAHILKYYTLDDATLRKAEFWQAQQPTEPTAEEFSHWLDDNGGKLHQANGPAHIATYSDGTYSKQWWREGQRHRAKGPALIVTGTDGSQLKQWYRAGEFIKEEHIAAPPGSSELSTIPGATFLPSKP